MIIYLLDLKCPSGFTLKVNSPDSWQNTRIIMPYPSDYIPLSATYSTRLQQFPFLHLYVTSSSPCSLLNSYIQSVVVIADILSTLAWHCPHSSLHKCTHKTTHIGTGPAGLLKNYSGCQNSSAREQHDSCQTDRVPRWLWGHETCQILFKPCTFAPYTAHSSKPVFPLPLAPIKCLSILKPSF